MSETVTFEESLEDTDWGLIIGKDGSLKGMFIPEGEDEAEVPEGVVGGCVRFFGVDPTEEHTVH